MNARVRRTLYYLDACVWTARRTPRYRYTLRRIAAALLRRGNRYAACAIYARLRMNQADLR